MKKITLATVKSFIKKNLENLYVNQQSSFDGMTDCVERRDEGFQKANYDGKNLEQTMGIQGVWFVRDSRDYFKPYNDGTYQGFEVFNSCGSCIVAIKN